MINMTTESISNTIFSPLKIWAEKSNGNWNLLIVSGFVLLIVGAILIFVLRNKIGETDERTSPIYLKSAFIMLGGFVLFDLIFPKGYMWQIFLLFKYSLAFLVSGVYLAVQYKKGF
ncbi:DUF2178 domain-containing protein [Priestia koreensis]|uniref:DUF2178 domain-containing protein n=1 Tax=Priestia koreensis TaxID=284581 RepID=UPI00204221E8|nr:DUF2178 domain-containing protein [Priestia koreensis]MCM3003310.1 DUF2178 domain-containing protein [Priestia koreensis]